MQRISLLIQGKVQGVFYRKSAAEKAIEIGVTGYVKNQSDGSVYAEAQGTEEQLLAFESWCKRGPQRAIVSHVETTTIEVIIEEKSFIVLR